jgi:ribonuclease PH
MTSRASDRSADALRPIEFEIGTQKHAQGSVLVRWGDTHVLCAANFEGRVPPHRLDSGGGWLTAEYAMLPGSTQGRKSRERQVKGRSAEIQRLIGRSLRAAFDLDTLGPRTLYVDADVVQADGGTRCASITAGWVACVLAIRRLQRDGVIARKPLPDPVAAVSVGIRDGEVLTDLDYIEDSGADVDLNFVAQPKGIVEIQGTAEGRVFTRGQLDAMVEAATNATNRLFELQRAAVEQ